MKTILQLIGLRTDCCNAPIVSWYRNKHYCYACERWLDQSVVATKSTTTTKPQPPLHTKPRIAA